MKAIIFDCDGTLVDSERHHYEAWVYALKQQGYSLSLEEYQNYVGIPVEQVSQMLAKKLNRDCALQLKHDKSACYQGAIQKGVLPIQETFAFLQRLIQEQPRLKYKLAIASGAPRSEIFLYLHHLNLEDVFDVVISGRDDLSHYSDPEGVNKPKPYIYQETAKQLGVLPQECVAIEDSQSGVLAGVTAGCATAAVPTSFSLKHDFSAAHLVLPSFQGYTVDRFLDAISAHLPNF